MTIERLNELIDRVGIGGHIGIKDARDIADVLRDEIERLRTEPCEWCDGNGIVQWYEGCYTVSTTNYRTYLIVRYCPNCGRKLGDE